MLAALVLGAVGILAFHGIFQNIKVSEQAHGPFQFVFQPQVYVTQQSVGRITGEIDDMLGGIGVENTRPMAIYYPDGSVQVGLAVEDVQLSLMLSNGTATRTVPEYNYIEAVFPWKSPLSDIVGYYKVDRELQKHRAMNGYDQAEGMTLYQGDHILYLARIKDEG